MIKRYKDLELFSDDIVKKYQNGISTYDIAREMQSHPWYVNKILQSKNIKRRSRKETNHMRFLKDIPISQQLYEMIDGWLLGDGSLHFTGVQAYFSFVSKYEEYINYVLNNLENDGIICRKYHGVDKKIKTSYYRIMTPSTIQFGELYHKWYQDGKKIVPHNLQLSNNAIKNWIMDDGTLDKKMGHMRFCTCAFTIIECETLSKKLNDFIGDINGTWVIEKNKNPRIYMPKKAYNNLKQKIGSCEVSCFKYKFNQQLTNIGDVF